MKKNYLRKNHANQHVDFIIKNSTHFKNLALLFLVFFSYNNAFAQGASCAAATPVNVNQEYTTFIVNDTTVNDPTPATCNGQSPQRDGWFSFVASGTEASIFATATNRNPILYAYSGTCGSLTFLNCANITTSTSGHTEILSLAGLTSGVTYYVRVGNSGNNNMSLSSFVVVTNDKCSNATLLTSNTSCVTVTGGTAGATDNDEVGDCVTGTENAVWFQFQAVTTTHIVTVDGNAVFDAVVNVISACGATGTPTGGGCVDNTGDDGIETLTLTGLTVGSFYKIQVHDWWGDLVNNGFTICVTHTTPPPTITNLTTPTSGCVGSNITITGTNLTGATAANVKIGGTSVSSIVSNNGTTIVAVIGTGTTGTVTVTTAGGTATSTGVFTVNPLPAAISGAATVCIGATTTFTDATAGGTWSVTNGTGSATITGADVTGVSAGTVTVTYTLPTTCNVTKSLTVLQPPGAIAGGSATVCSGSTTPAFTNPVAGGTWSVTNGTGTATIAATGILTAGTAGTVTVNYTIGTCPAVTFAVTINPLPAAIAGAATVCTGTTTTLTDTTAGGTWSITNGTGSATITAGGDVSGVTAGSVTVTYTLPTTCNVTKSITVQQTPGAISGGSATVCEGTSTPAFTNPNAGGTWSVTNGTGTANITAGGVLNGTAAGTVTVNYTIGSCIPATFGVTIIAAPVAIVGAATVCTGGTTTYTNAVSGGTWSVTNGTGTATITAGGDVSGVTAGTVTVNYAIGSCTVTKVITVQQTPGAIAGGASTVCVGSSTPAFTNPSAGGTWSVTSGTGTANISAGGVLSGVTAGTVTVNYIIGLCTAATFPVTVNPIPAAISGSATLCTGSTTTFTDATAGGTWSITNGTGTASITNPGGVVTPGTTGTVTVVYTLPTTCNVTKALTIEQTPGANAGGATTVCSGYTTPAFTNPNAGGTWSVTNGTGTATIAGTGILTGGNAGTVTVNYTIGSCTPATSSVTVNPTPGTPTLPVNSLITNSGFTVSWTASAGAVNYVLEVFTDAARTIPISGSPFTVASPTITYTVTGLNVYTPYYYRIKATNATCSSAYLLGSVTTTIINDNCINATALTVNPTSTCTTSTSSTTVNATQSQTGCGGSNADDDVWFSFVATGTTHTVTVTPGSLTNAVLEVFSGSCAGLSSFGCVNATTGANAEITTLTSLTSGVTYYVRVNSNGAVAQAGTFTVCVTSPPVNNQCANATTLPCGTTNLAGTTIGTVSYTNNSTCTMSDNGVWYTFVGDGNSNIISVTTTGFDIEMAIASGSCGALTNVTCQDGYFGTATETYTFNAVLGTTYYVYVAYYTAGATTGNFTISRACLVPPVNDDCAGAIPISVGTTCSSSTYTNLSATATAGVTAPGCANYSGADVWFTAVVPATGELTVTLQAGSMTDSGMAFYSGSCGSLALLDCDNNGAAGAMSQITLTGLPVGSTIYIRVWENGNDNNGTFGICATTPSCPSPADLYANILSTTSVTVNWTASAPPASGGYQYYINTTGTAPTAGTTPTGTTAPGVLGVTLTGLTPGLKYYFWVRSFCGGSDTSSWFGPTNYAPCAVGNGTGTTSLACIYPVAGAAGSGADPSVSCTSSTCTNLEVTYTTLKQTTDYVATEITYAPPYQFTCLQNPVSVNIDDVWSPTITLPFNFCFYGNNYNKCLMGSNGVITFDTTGNTPGGRSEWQFNTNLPSTTLFKNSIFGVYHDIDPSKGGQVGWELITLNTGCRALVASWNEIPMYSFSCNSVYYTGMIVLYENSNVIEVYVKEKNICSTWNGGNAIVGIQNATGTQASYPTTPTSSINTNDINSDWSAVTKAWRFTPNGTTISPTIQWYQGTVASGTQIPAGSGGTSATLNVCPAVTTLYTAEVTYPLCTGNLKVTDPTVITVTGNKIWDGSTDNNWNVADNWTPSGIPTSANCVIVPVTANNPIISNTPDAVGYNLAVYSGAQLTMNPDRNLTITDRIAVNGTFTINNNSNLVQINDTAVNTGNIIYKRIAPNIRGYDYVYWSSPVLNQNMGTIYDSGTQGLRYQWNTTLNNNNGAGGNISQGIWEAASGIMTQARGYIIRGSSNYNLPAGNIPTSFTGVPGNGIIPYTVQRGVYTGSGYNGANGVPITNLNDNYNLLGNPYPSSINALKFLELNTYNASTNPTGQLLGNVKLWSHGTDPNLTAGNPFYGSYLYNYTANDYIPINYMGSTTPGVGDIIRSGQAFFVQMRDGAAGSGTVNFNNSMRYNFDVPTSTYIPYTNNNFFKNGTTTNSEITLERHRIWLDLVSTNIQPSRILLGYAANATNNYDPLFDAITAVPSTMKLFSKIENDNEVYEIQGRVLPFDVNDEIAIGMKAPTQGNYTFAIAAVDGLFETQNIYLKDNLLNITHDLKVNPYHFTTPSGVINDRFKIVYINNALGIPTHTLDNSIKVITNEEVTVNSSNLSMESIDVYNLLGQKLNSYKNINSNHVVLSGLHKNNTTLMLKIKLQTGETVTKKIIY